MLVYWRIGVDLEEQVFDNINQYNQHSINTRLRKELPVDGFLHRWIWQIYL